MDISEKQIDKLMSEMAEEYNSSPERGIQLTRLEDSWQLCTKSDYYDYIHKLKEKSRRAALTNAGLEVLSVVAYNQPVTRSAIEFIRGVNSDGPLNNLVASGLVKEMGRLDAPGRPILFGTTEEFLRCFNLSSLAELPEVDEQYTFDGLTDSLNSAPINTVEASDDQITMDFENEEEKIAEESRGE